MAIERISGCIGRHTDLAMSLYMSILAISGVLLLVKTYIITPKKRRKTTP